ncbi:YcxB family protein [Streptomyces sp. NPDC006984]|uniref:YcxB family protein n=1 Tax=Streptomyces sp. NPDC006984 TaxID=3155463 RepID=UPI0034114E33
MGTRGGDSTDRDSGTAELAYRLTAADVEEALRARARRTAVGRGQALMAPLTAAFASVVSLAVIRPPLPAWIISLVLALALGCWASVRGLRTMARRMFSVAQPYGQCRTVVDGGGMVTTAERASFSMDWTVYREYLETPGLFVLMGGDRATGVGVLPKRGAADPADVDLVRATLDRNLKRV